MTTQIPLMLPHNVWHYGCKTIQNILKSGVPYKPGKVQSDYVQTLKTVQLYANLENTETQEDYVQTWKKRSNMCKQSDFI